MLQIFMGNKRIKKLRLKGLFFFICGILLMVEAVSSILKVRAVHIPIYVSIPFSITALIMIIVGLTLVFRKIKPNKR